MNVLQIMKQARFELDQIRSGGTVSALQSDEEVLQAVNTAMDRVARLVRLSGEALLSGTVQSDGASIDFAREVYAPSALQLTPGVTDYTLPPNLIRIDYIVPRTTGYEGVRFRPVHVNDRRYLEARVLPANTMSSVRNGEVTFLYAIVGERTLRISPVPQDTIDIELMYQEKPLKLLYATAGTVTTALSTAVAGAGTAWLDSDIRTPAELVVVASPVSAVTLSKNYPRVTSIVSNTALTLARAFTAADGTVGAGQAYALAMVPRLPEEHHSWLAQLTAAIMCRKVNTEISEKLIMGLEKELLMGVGPELALRQLQESHIVDEAEVAGQ